MFLLYENRIKSVMSILFLTYINTCAYIIYVLIFIDTKNKQEL